MTKVSVELKETVAALPHIKEVHYDKKGNHFFNVHEYKGKQYSRSVPEFVPKMETKAGKEVQVGTKMAQTWLEDHLIVKTLSRKEVLDAEVDATESAEDKLAAANAKIADLEAKLAEKGSKKK